MECLSDLQANTSYTGPLARVKAWFLSPGFRLVTEYRFVLRLERKGLWAKVVARLLWNRMAKRFGCYLSPKATIGAGLSFPHPVAIVIGEGSKIGNNVRIYQGVTVGRANDSRPEYPTILDGVTIYAGATLIGHIVIGEGATIGAGVVVTNDVPAGAIVVQDRAFTKVIQRT